jgi:RHS repeat-associated protein
MRTSSLCDRIPKSAVLLVALLFLWSSSLLSAAPKDFGQFSGSQVRNPASNTGVPPTPGAQYPGGSLPGAVPNPGGPPPATGASPFAATPTAASGAPGSPQGNSAPADNNEYDSEGRIVGFVDSAGNKTQWSFDSQGRKVDRAAAQQTQEERLDNTFNQYTSVGGVARTYDPNGNLTSDGTKNFKWDAFNRLREVTTTTGTLIAAYTYDADGRRLRKTLGPAATAGVSTDYKYAGWRVMEESAPTTATPRLQRVYGKNLDEVLVENVNRDGDMTCTGTSDTARFFLQTEVFSLAGTFVPGIGIVEAFEFNPYGPASRLTDGDGDGVVNFDDTDIRTPFDPSTPGGTFATLYGGHPVDEETGLIWMRDRYYSATLGRFISPDHVQLPVGPVWGSVATLIASTNLPGWDPLRGTAYADGPNLLAYVGDSPVNFTDPLGLLKAADESCNGYLPMETDVLAAINALSGLSSTQSTCMLNAAKTSKVKCKKKGCRPCTDNRLADTSSILSNIVVCKDECNSRTPKCGYNDLVNILVHEYAHACRMPGEQHSAVGLGGWPRTADDPDGNTPGPPWAGHGIPGTTTGGIFPCTGK